MLKYKLFVYKRNRWRPLRVGPNIKVVGLYSFFSTSIFGGRTTLTLREAEHAVGWAGKRRIRFRLVKTFDGGIQWPIGKSGSLS